EQFEHARKPPQRTGGVPSTKDRAILYLLVPSCLPSCDLTLQMREDLLLPACYQLGGLDRIRCLLQHATAYCGMTICLAPNAMRAGNFVTAWNFMSLVTKTSRR